MREIEQVIRAAANGKIPGIWLWYGEERFLTQEALQVLKESYLKEDPSGSSIETVSAEEVSPSALVALANSSSFFSRRLIVVQDLPYFREGAGADVECFNGYFADPNPGTCLLFVADTVHKGRKFYKAVEKYGSILEFSSPRRTWEWQAWLKAEMDVRNKEMSPEAAALFLAWAGHQSGVLSRELDKLAVFTGERRDILPADVEQVVIRTAEATVFELLDAVARRSAGEATVKLHEVVRLEHPLKVMTLLVRQVRLLLGALAWRRRGEGGASLAAALNIRPYEAKKIWAQSQTMTESQLARALQECLRTEIALKNGGGDPVFLLEMMIIRFCSG
ncbi:DNA polymerase III subunit delta [Peptococcaceae bacterium CEB3]|nr:DNA polymerase III subunit delta [Peptococcaceae bacterium CEB3]